ncbi:TrmH family RNA methyltransferase [Clostridium chauvoei]|uniref:RNA methyltransferase n=2 Tax=Clostridium chauvoei TaxID=46867 RepID=A0ABD4REP2_9CLOT|nr:RNA methyltransferase [Clostridium chauvoei]ATD55272.1 RNA methyltransferase [Clostridium chauvoei]ATD57055.1 RNA methyltransferase [Clostridium chauvoei]MBX7279622.1 RNA methyltransferase [Clostridium chauvoei]MBX7281991.1 RNA methyltransferase [Clostridium chauvoei]MBX7284420.1 RNA methyltransferase [Clostridium chauvoei]
MIYIESKDNALFKATKKLKEKKNRIKEGKYIIEGFRLIEEAFKANLQVEYIILSEDSKEKLNEYLEEYIDKDSKIYVVNNNLIMQLTSTEHPQGVVAVVKNRELPQEIKGDFYLLCDKVQDPGNLGTIIRTAHAAGVDGIILTKGTVDIYNDKTIRSTMGSIFYVPIVYEDEDLTFLKKLKDNGFKLVATSLEESKDFFKEDLKGKIILSVGNEGNGISDEIFSKADKKVKIPMPGGAESLNVAIATSIILFEKVRQNLQ